MKIFPLKFLSPLDRMRNLLKAMKAYNKLTLDCKPDIFSNNIDNKGNLSKNKSLTSSKSEVF